MLKCDAVEFGMRFSDVLTKSVC